MTSLDKYILTIDDVLPIDTIGRLVKVLSVSDFNQATVGEEQVNLEVRRTFNLNLYRWSSSLTNVHWYNLLNKIFYNAHLEYMKYFNTNESFIYSIKDIQALKYEKGGKYTPVKNDRRKDSGPRIRSYAGNRNAEKSSNTMRNVFPGSEINSIPSIAKGIYEDQEPIYKLNEQVEEQKLFEVNESIRSIINSLENKKVITEQNDEE